QPISPLDRPSVACAPCPRAPPRPPMTFSSYMLDSPSIDRPFGVTQTLVQAQTVLHLEGRVGRLDRPEPAGRPRRPALLMGNGKGGRSGVSWRSLRSVRGFLRASGIVPASRRRGT